MKTLALILAFAAVPTLPLDAQSFNIDIGTLTPGGAGAGTPAPVYGAAAHQPGMWNSISGLGTGPYVLVDLAANPTAVVCNRDNGTGGIFGFNNLMTTGYFQSLMDDGQNGDFGSRTYVFSGLLPGVYTVFTYAWAPDNGTYLTSVTVAASTSTNPQIVGGTLAATNTFTPGITHAVHVVTVGRDGMILVTCSAAAGACTINGFQISNEFRFTMSQPAPGGALTLLDAGGRPGSLYMNLVTTTPGAFPTGPLFGLDMTLGEAVAEIAFGPPFFGSLDADGSATYVVPAPVPSGITFYAVGIEVDAPPTMILALTAPFAHTLP